MKTKNVRKAKIKNIFTTFSYEDAYVSLSFSADRVGVHLIKEVIVKCRI